MHQRIVLITALIAEDPAVVGVQRLIMMKSPRIQVPETEDGGEQDDSDPDGDGRLFEIHEQAAEVRDSPLDQRLAGHLAVQLVRWLSNRGCDRLFVSVRSMGGVDRARVRTRGPGGKTWLLVFRNVAFHV